MNYNYSNINEEKAKEHFPYGVSTVTVIERDKIQRMEAGSQKIGDKKNSPTRFYIYVRMIEGSYEYLWFENVEQVDSALDVFANGEDKLALIKSRASKEQTDYRLRRDYIVEFNSAVYHEAISRLII